EVRLFEDGSHATRDSSLPVGGDNGARWKGGGGVCRSRRRAHQHQRQYGQDGSGNPTGRATQGFWHRSSAHEFSRLWALSRQLCAQSRDRGGQHQVFPSARRGDLTMRPLAVLLGIVMGSAVSLAVGLGMTFIVFLFMPQHAERLLPEKGPLLQGILLF